MLTSKINPPTPATYASNREEDKRKAHAVLGTRQQARGDKVKSFKDELASMQRRYY